MIIGSNNSSVDKLGKFHFRVLILDPDTQRTALLERSFLSMYDNNGSANEVVVCEDAQFFYVRNIEQLSTIPGASAYNAAWISFDFPDYKRIAENLYLENPFCYQVFYGKKSCSLSQILHSRPIGYIEDVSNTDNVYREMAYIWKTSALEKNVLKLTSRSTFCTVAFDKIVYCQSQGHKSYIYVNTPVRNIKTTEDDIFVKSADNRNQLFAYQQNKKLGDIAALLPESKFIRVHQSYIVNSRYSHGIRTKNEGWFLVLTDSQNHVIEIPVSEKYRLRAKSLFGFGNG